MAILVFRGFHDHKKTNTGKGIIGNDIFKYFLPFSIILYFNLVHCVYMSFGRYAFPLMPLVSIYTGYLFAGTTLIERAGSIFNSDR